MEMYKESMQPVQDASIQLDSLHHELAEIHQRIRDEIPDIDRVSYISYDAKTGQLTTSAESSVDAISFANYSFPLKSSPELERCAEQQITRIVDDIPASIISLNTHSKWLLDNNFNSSYTVPIYKGQNFIGFIFFDSYKKSVFTQFVQKKMSLFSDLICYAVNTEHSLLDAILCSAEITKELSPGYKKESKEHMERVSHYALVIAKEVAVIYNLDDELIENVHRFSRLHDIGKSMLSTDILLKPHCLIEVERQAMRNYVSDGIVVVNRIVENLGYPSHRCIEVLKEIISCHQEFLDGSGYPNGLTKSAIPVSARIVTVANIFDALTSHRPYKQACCVSSALLELEKMVSAGKIDGRCVNALRNHQEYLVEIIHEHPESDPSL